MPITRRPLFDQPGETASRPKGNQAPKLNHDKLSVPSNFNKVTVQSRKPALKPRARKKLGYFLLVAGLILLALALSGCSSYPGADPPCQGANAGAPGCANPVGNLFNQNGTLPWFVDWVFQIIKALVVGLGITAVELAVSVFWLIFNNLSSTDFYACAQSGGSNPTCAATSVFQQIRTIAMLLLPLVLSWKIFKNYFIGGFIPPLFESAISFLPKIGIGVLVLSQLELIVSSAFGLSNLAFNAILGNPQSLSNTALAILGNNQSGVGGLAQVANVPILIVLNSMCLLLAVIFVLLGVLFILRTVIIFILMVLGPFAIMAGLTDEFKPQFYQWLQGLQAMLIAPLPVAVCFRLISTYVTTVPDPSGDPAGFFLRLVYVESFLFIGGILMFKIAGQTGEMLFGVVVGALGALAGFLTGGAAMGTAGSSIGSSTTGQEKVQNTASPVTSNAGSGASGLEGTLAALSSESGGFTPARAGVAVPAAFSSSGGGWGSDLSQRQHQQQMTQALRSLAENMAANRYAEAVQGLYPSLSNSSASQSRPAKNYNYLADRNLQHFLHAAGAAAGIKHAPRLSFAPVPGGGSGSSATPPVSNSSASEEEVSGELPVSESELVIGEVEASAPPSVPALLQNGESAAILPPPPPPTTALPAGKVPPRAPLGPGGVAPLLPGGTVAGGSSQASLTTPQLVSREAPPRSGQPFPLMAGGASRASSSPNNRVLPPNTPAYVMTGPYGNQSGATYYFDRAENEEVAGLLPAPAQGGPVVFNVLTDPYGYEQEPPSNYFTLGSQPGWEQVLNQAEEARFVELEVELEPPRMIVPETSSIIPEVVLIPTSSTVSPIEHAERELSPAPAPLLIDKTAADTGAAATDAALKAQSTGLTTSASAIATTTDSASEAVNATPETDPSALTVTKGS